MKTSKLFEEYFIKWHGLYENVVKAQENSEEAVAEMTQLGIALRKSMLNDEKDAQLWCALKLGVENVVAEAEFKMDVAKGRMN